MTTRKLSQTGLLALTASFALALLAVPSASAVEFLPGIEWPEPAIVTPGEQNSQAPADAIVLFDGKDLSQWKNADGWSVVDGNMVVGKGNVTCKPTFGDCQVHIEWSSPTPAKGSGQNRGNSGLYLMGIYEMQILNSYENKTYFDGQASSIYKQTPPLVNAMRKPGEWNTYDVIWTRPRFNKDGSVKTPAYITALHNGILTLNHFELQGNTPYNHAAYYTAHEDKLPIRLQDHGSPVRYRNIWVRETKPMIGKRVSEPMLLNHSTGKKTPAKK